MNIFKNVPNSRSHHHNDYDDYDDFGDSDGDDDEDDIPYVATTKPEVTWYKSGETEIDLSSGKTRDGIELKVGEIPKSSLFNHDKFYACLDCGQMAWA
jgi:hypothetical protein